jgi:hypothetical protein
MTLDELAEFPTKSTQHMATLERRDGIAVMLDDLRLLATQDGCIAAGWALEFIETITPTVNKCPAPNSARHW